MVYLVCIILLWISREDKTKWMPFIRRKLFLCFWKVVLYVDNYFNLPKYKFIMLWFPTGTSSSIRHRFDVEIPRGKFMEITSILKGESTCKLWHRFDVDISTWIRLSKSTKYRWVLHVDFSMSFLRQIDVTSVLAVSILSFSNIFCSGNLF